MVNEQQNPLMIIIILLPNRIIRLKNISSRIMLLLFFNIYVQFALDDDGMSLKAALIHHSFTFIK